MLKPTVSTLYQSAMDSGIAFRLSSAPIPTLEIDCTQLTSEKPLSRAELDKLEREFREKIEPHRQELTEFLKQQRLIKEFSELLASKSIDKMSIPILKDIHETLDNMLR